MIARALALVLLFGCGDPPPAPRPAIRASYGGVIVALGEHIGELVVHTSGELAFHVRSEHDLSDAGLTVTIADQAQARHAVGMHWAERMNGFVGRMDRGTPARGEAEVLLVRSGRPMRARARIARLLPPAEHRGSVVSVGDLVVEVAVQSDGRAELYVLRPPRIDPQMELTLGIPSADGALHPLSLVWDPEGERYTGRIEGVEPRPGPLEVIASRDGREHVGRGRLLEIALRRPELVGSDVPEDLQLELPELGSDLPAVIAIPPAEP
jgi:hypothetical protein